MKCGNVKTNEPSFKLIKLFTYHKMTDHTDMSRRPVLKAVDLECLPPKYDTGMQKRT